MGETSENPCAPVSLETIPTVVTGQDLVVGLDVGVRRLGVVGLVVENRRLGQAGFDTRGLGRIGSSDRQTEGRDRMVG